MKIVYLANSIIPSRAANSIHVMKMCQAFSDNDHEVTLLVPERKSKEADVDQIFDFYDVGGSFQLEKLPRPKLSSFGTFAYNYLAGRRAAQLNPDLAYGRTVIGCYFAAARSVPTAFESHTPIDQGRFGKIQKRFFERLTSRKNSMGVFVISDALRDYYKTNYSSLADEIYIARDGADPVDESVQPVELGESRKKLQVGYIGHLYDGRGMNIIAKMAEECSWANFHIIGGEPEDVSAWQAKLDSIGNIKFYGFLPPNKLNQYRLAFDVQLAPYQRDLQTRGGRNTVRWMSPLKIFEYMAAGRAIVASDLSAIREILEHRQTALLCDPESVSQWVEAIKLLDSNPELRERLGQGAQSEFTARYTWSARAQKIVDQVDMTNQ